MWFTVVFFVFPLPIEIDLVEDVVYHVVFFVFPLLVDVGSVEGLAYHRGWDTLYWTSSTSATISRHTIQPGPHAAFTKEPVVIMAEDDHPHVLALDECQK